MSEKKAGICFHGSLNDFLHRANRNSWITYTFQEKQAVKDAIEALGVPHPEVAVILSDGVPVGLLNPLSPDARVEVYPLHHPNPWSKESYLRTPLPEPMRFILDVHLGKLARLLRMLGIDALYENNFSDATIARIAEVEKRTVLTRDVGLLKHKAIEWGYWLRSQQGQEQLAEVIRYFGLHSHFQPLTRCIACNGMLVKASRETVLEKLPPKTRLYFDEFFQCSSCHRVYWEGSHYERMQALIRRLEEEL